MDIPGLTDSSEPVPVSTEIGHASMLDDAQWQDEHEQERTVQSSEPAGQQPRRWHRWILPLVAFALIVVAIRYLQSGPVLPFLGRPGGSHNGQEAGDLAQGNGFVSFQSKGIKLGAEGGPPPKVGEAAPDFALLDMRGKVIRLSDLRGKTVVMNFWATWCGPCRLEFPEFVRLYEQNADRGLVVFGVDMQENPEAVRSFAAEFNATFPIVIDTKGDVARQYRVPGLPATFFIDGQGVLRGQQIGALTAESLARKLAEAGFTTARSP